MTVIRVHHCDGTAGTASSAAGEGFTSLTGTAPNYTASGYSGTCLEWPAHASGTVAYYQDTLSNPFVGFYLRVPSTLTAAAAVASGQASGSSQGSLIVNIDLTLSIYSGLGTKIATSATKLTVGSWARIEWNIAATTQELRIFTDPAGTTPTETLTGASGGTAMNQWRFGSYWGAQTGGPVDLDEITVCDAWPDMGVATPPGNGRKIYLGGVWHDVTSTVITGVAPAGNALPATLPYTLT